MEKDWKEVALDVFQKYSAEARRYNIQNENVPELAWFYAGKSDALAELLEAFGSKPEV